MSTRGFVGYRPKTKIYGWYNHYDSYPGYLGKRVLEKFCSLTQKQIRHFFLQVVRLRNQSEVEDRKIFHFDWTDRSGRRIDIKNASGFIKNGIFCEYSYVFDLSGDQKSLMLFRGYGQEPTPGYEDYFERGSQGVIYFNNFVGRIPGGLKFDDAYVLMRLLLATGNIPNIHHMANKDIPLIPAMLPDIIPDQNEWDRYSDIISSYMELRLRGIIKQGE